VVARGGIARRQILANPVIDPSTSALDRSTHGQSVLPLRAKQARPKFGGHNRFLIVVGRPL